MNFSTTKNQIDEYVKASHTLFLQPKRVPFHSLVYYMTDGLGMWHTRSFLPLLIYIWDGSYIYIYIYIYNECLMFCLIIKSPHRNTKSLNNFMTLLNYFITSFFRPTSFFFFNLPLFLHFTIDHVVLKSLDFIIIKFPHFFNFVWVLYSFVWMPRLKNWLISAVI